MKIGLITQWYDPEVGSAGIPGSIARSLERLGHSVTVLTGFPNYPTGDVYPGYRVRPHVKERHGSIELHRVALYPSHDGRAGRRIANFASFATSASAAAPRCLRDCDVALVYSTPATVGAAGLALRRVRGIPFVLLIQDMWPDTLLASGMLPKRANRAAWAATYRFCNRVYGGAERIAVIAPSMKRTLIDRGVPAWKVEPVYNWADESLFSPQGRPEKVPGDPFEVMYAGSIGDVQGLETAVSAMAQLDGAADVRLRFVGAGVAHARLKAQAFELGLDDVVTFEGSRPTVDMPALMASADAQLICLRDLPLFRGTVPSKFQAILASGLPMVVSAPGDVAKLTETSGAGIAVPPEDPGALAKAITALSCLPQDELEAYGAAGREFYVREQSEAVGARRLQALLHQAAQAR